MDDMAQRMDGLLSATVVVVTRNRSTDLRRALKSAIAQDVACEILVLDDASDDGSPEMVEKEFPGVRLVRSAGNLGCVAQRSRAANLASGDILVSLDDDAEFRSPSTVREVLGKFEYDWVGAVAIPFVNINFGERVFQRAPLAGVYLASEFVGTAYACRRRLFIDLGGFRDSFFYSNEESDYCLKMLRARYFVRLGDSEPIVHYVSPKRKKDSLKNVYFFSKNMVMFAWHNTPWLYVVPQALMASMRSLWYYTKHGNFLTSARGILAACWCIAGGRAERNPVDMGTFKLYRHLRTRGPVRAESLPPGWAPIDIQSQSADRRLKSDELV